MGAINRRELLTALGAAPAAAALILTDTDVQAAARAVDQMRVDAQVTGQPAEPRFFTPAEMAMLTVLADMIIPRDARSGSASDAGAPAFIDYIVAEQPNRQIPMRGGLAWVTAHCQTRFEKTFLDASDAERRQLVDDIAWPQKAAPGMSQGAAFFTSLRDLVAAGFFSSKIGMADLGYLGNRVSAWDGAPAAVLQKLGVE
jgi:gluconate 2-dehydrogenase gamma chain